MNAFMIFARERRPQISAANQMMRTGDVSKILSKEWNSMEMVGTCAFFSFLLLSLALSLGCTCAHAPGFATFFFCVFGSTFRRARSRLRL